MKLRMSQFQSTRVLFRLSNIISLFVLRFSTIYISDTNNIVSCFHLPYSNAKHYKMTQWQSYDCNLLGMQAVSSFTNTDDKSDIKMKIAKHNLLSVAAAIMNVPSEIFTTPPMLDPYPPNGSDQITRRQKVTKLMQEGWDDPSDGFSIPREEENYINDLMRSNETGRLPSTYGEITQLGARQLFAYMKLCSDISILQSPEKKLDCTRHDTKKSFVDLGCGSGRLLMQSYLELPHVCNFTGIELAKARYTHATYAWNVLKDLACILRHEVNATTAFLHFLHGDLFDLDISSLTHVYVASLCFTDDMMMKLGNKILKEARSLQCIATLKPFPSQYNDALGGEPTRHYVEMTWTRPRGQGCIVYFYYL